MKKFVKPNFKGKKHEKIILDAAQKGDLTAYVMHSPTGAMIPVDPDAIIRMKNGETMDLAEAEKLYARFYFKLPFLAIRWGMKTKECLGKLMELEVPCFLFQKKQSVMDIQPKWGKTIYVYFKNM
jgi:hypothetical protein